MIPYGTESEEKAMADEPPASYTLLSQPNRVLIADAEALEREAALIAVNGPYKDSLPARYRRASAALRLVAEGVESGTLKISPVE